MRNVQTLLFEENVVSLRPVTIQDDGNLVTFRLMPAWLDSSIPRKPPRAPKDFAWTMEDFAWLYRHRRSPSEETKLMTGFPCVEQGVLSMSLESPPEFRLLWTDSGNDVALYLNGEPWAFIAEETHIGYSKGILEATTGALWNQELFDKLFKSDAKSQTTT